MRTKLVVSFLLAQTIWFTVSAQPGSGTLLEPEPISFVRLYSELELDRVPTGILADYGVKPVDFSLFNGSSSNNNCATIQDIYYLLQGISASTVDNLLYTPDATAMMNSMSNTLATTSRIPVGIVAYKYNRFCDDAISAGKILYEAQNEIVEDVYDNNNQWVDPYTEGYLVAFAPYQKVAGQTVVFDFSTIYRYTNLSIQSILFDPGDGVFQSVTGTTFTKYYSTAATYYMRLKVILTNGINLFAKTTIEIINILTGNVPAGDEVFTSNVSSGGVYPTAIVDVLYANGTETSFTKQPVIIAEGFDPFTDPYGILFNEYTNDYGLVRGRGCNDINTFKYGLTGLDDIDLVYINWNNSTASIESNADIFMQVINWVNTNNLTGNRLIVIGQSMGGLIARYALCSMESLEQNHNVAVYASGDSPHLGVNVPLGFVYAAQHLYDFLDGDSRANAIIDLFHFNPGDMINTQIGGNNLLTYLAEFLALRDGMSVRQMLMQYVDDDYEVDNSVYSSFQTTLRNLGFPQGDAFGPTLNLSLSNGGVNNYVTNTPFFDISMKGSIGDVFKLLLSGLLDSSNSTSLNTLWESLFSPSHSSLQACFNILPLNLPGAKVYECSVTDTTTFLWGGDPSVIKLYSTIHNAPAAQKPLDITNGSYYPYSLPSFYLNPLSSVWANLIFSMSHQDKFMFVPTVSSLCFKKGESAPTISDYLTNFTSTGVDMGMIPFDGYKFYSNVASSHIAFADDDLTWIMDKHDLAIVDTVLANGTHQFLLNNPSFTPAWSTSNPTIATMSSSGQLILHSFGTFYVYATITDTNSCVRLKKEVTIPEPLFGGFPSYSLQSTDMTLDGVTARNDFYVTATPSTPLDPVLMPYIRYCWGRKEGTSSSITWTETTYLNHFFAIPLSDSRVVYFRVKYLDQYSTTYSILCTIRPHIIISDPEGYLYTEDMGDPFVQVKSSNDIFLISCLGEELYYSHNPTLSEICIDMLEKEIFKSTVKQLRPWGPENQIVIPYSCTDVNNDVTAEDVMVFIYRTGIE